MGSSSLDLLAEVAAEIWEEQRAKTEEKQLEKFKPKEEPLISLSLSPPSEKIVSGTEKNFLGKKKHELDTVSVLMRFIKFCADKAQKEKVSSLKARTTGFTFPLGLIPRKKRSVIVRKTPEIVGSSNSGFGPFDNIRELNKSRKRCFPIEGKDKEKTFAATPLKKKQKRVFDFETLPELPVEVSNKIQELGGSEPKLVIQKKLFSSDLNPNNGRFSIPQCQIRAEFVTESERAVLDEHEGHKVRGMEVLVLDPVLREFNLQLKMWRMAKTHVYNLTHKWNEIVTVNKHCLCVDNIVQLWSFRRSNNQLSFALVKV
ncbi:B3 domain-containing protein family [Quillaja saponaria]|uniref:B3 domain-containing protein family n=1 Tax=Quillaja saponaria TaxID=32244 RepID=A0AAD7LTY3_QUISA|nr:B3 domain-containing protein family [Quillaja saponaria]